MNWYFIAALALCLANFFLHKPISDVCDAVLARVGFRLYDRGALLAFSVVCVAAVAPLAARRRQALTDRVTFGVLVILGALTVVAQHWLLVTNIGLIHLPQFGVIAALLYAGGLSAPAAWLAATAAGVVDEIYQYLVIYAGRSDVYFDYNDMILNAIGAAWVVVLLSAGARAVPTGSVPGRSLMQKGMVGAGLLLALLGAWWLQPPQLRPFLRVAATYREYHLLSLAEGLLTAIFIWAVVRLAAARRAMPEVDSPRRLRE